MKSNEISAYQLRRCKACGVCRVDHFPSARCAKFVAKVESHQSQLSPEDNKFHQGAPDGKHYWITPPELYQALDEEFDFDFDPAPFPLPEGFDGLTAEWGESSYLNPPFGSIMHEGRKKGPTAWARKALTEWRKGKTVVMVYPIDKWVLMLLQAGAEVRNLGDVRWLATEDGTAGKGTGRHIACFVLRAASVPVLETPTPAWNQPFPDECKHYNLPENCHWCKEESTAPVEPVPAPRLEHVLELRDDGWSLEHPQVCRESKSLLDCPVHSVVKSHEDEMELWEHGRFNVGLDEYDELEKLSSAPPVGPQAKEN